MASGLVTKIRQAGTKAAADRALGGVNALADYAQVWSIITPSDASRLRTMADFAHKAWHGKKGGAA